MKAEWRRFVASLIDGACAIVTYVCVLLMFSTFFLPNFSPYMENYNRVVEVLLSTNLYVEDNGEVRELHDDEIDAALEIYYGDSTYYYQAKIASGFYEVIDGELCLKDDIDQDKLIEFYQEEYQTALTDVSQHNKEYQNAYDNCRDIYFWGRITIIFFSTAIFYLIIPLCLKKRSLGRLIFKLDLMEKNDDDTNVYASNVQLIVRYIAFVMIVVLMSLWLFWIPAIVNLIVYIVDKKHRGIPDMLALTYVKYDEEKMYEEKRR